MSSDYRAPPDTMQILAVDDTPENLKLLKAILSQEGYQVRLAVNGKLALRSVKIEAPDLILLDVKMPEMDGYEVCKHLKTDALSREIPVIFISAQNEIENKVRGFDAGAVDYISKPFEAVEVLARVNKHLSLRMLQKQMESLVKERTKELEFSNNELRRENSMRKEAEQSLHRSLEEKNMLLQELYHRTKNNMQVISSLMALQRSRIRNSAAQRILTDLQSKIQTMALVHQKLYESNDLSYINLSDYVLSILALMKSSYGVKEEVITIHAQVEDTSISIDTAMPLGMLVNELLLNSLKHAFPEGRSGSISLDLSCCNDEILFDYKDTGVGLPENFDVTQTQTLGMLIMQNTVEKQLAGTLEIFKGSGFHCRMCLKTNIYSERLP